MRSNNKETFPKKLSNKIPISILLGFGTWVLFVFCSLPFFPFDAGYVPILLLAAPLFLIPLSWKLFPLPSFTQALIFPITLLLAISFLLPTGYFSATLTIPWLILVSFLSIDQFVKFKLSVNRRIDSYCHLMAFWYLPIGAAWALADRLAYSPFGFDPMITTLTAVHFHYAGFLLPFLVGFVLQQKKSTAFLNFIGWGVILGIPLVAIGITATKFQFPVFIEVFAATIMATAGMATGGLHLLLGWKYRSNLFGKLWLFAGIALISGMTLALLYGWRHYYPIPAITIPWMYAFHGTMNAIGFALPGVLGWYLFLLDFSHKT